VATYQYLFWNKSTPRSLAIIQPGTGFGGNWTDFRKSDGPLGQAVLNNPAGKPAFIYYGGDARGNGHYEDFDWLGYEKVLTIQPYGKNFGQVAVWENLNYI
jgi:hypothetical protein